MSLLDQELMWIKLQDLQIDSIVGIYQHERQRKQRLTLEIELAIHADNWLQAATKGDLAQSLDYGNIAQQVESLVTYSEFRLLESLYFLLGFFFLRPPALGEERVQIQGCRIKILKPFALSSQQTPLPSIQGELSLDTWLKSFATKPLELSEEQQAQIASVMSACTDSNTKSDLKVETVLTLPEVIITHVFSQQAGQLSLGPQQDLLPLSTQFSQDSVGQQISITWSTPFSALLFTRLSFEAEVLR